MDNYNFTKKELKYIDNFNFEFSVDKKMSDEQLFKVIETIEDDILLHGITNDRENSRGKLGSDILTKMALEDAE